ncbi:HAAS signaling domain-containing protein [Klenkia taihuensis]|uniref:Uncharacterized protein n=1 Tax=Klenkia taihuensis TaxID=1225127 RepID=A0A1I1PD44_9ACTN|nr:hypothetical protein [Klenkia taihuensis]GHE11438.1 hypothetical protein GCM10011381_24760 [Klenkia taihuensis]SFD04913.1 hypothetical protein SAMN05661030_2420 [Klenkia taihuensis]
MNAETAPALARYRQELIVALRLKDVPGDRIGEAVAEVESHVADTGEDPVAAFGPAKEYARTLATGQRRDPWWSTAITLASAGTAGWLVAQGALAQLLGEEYRGLAGWVWVLVGLVVGIPAAVRVQRRSSRVRDPRTGADMVPSSPWGVVVLVAIPVVLVLAAWGLILVTR